MQHKKSVVVASLLSSLLLVSAQEVAQTSVQQGDVDPNGSSTCVTIDTNLRYKMKDASSDGDISSLQDFLIANRYMQGTPTGYFGLGTFNAVKQFQKRSGLSPTGYVGALTRAKIKDVSCASDAQTTASEREDVMKSFQKPADNKNQGIIQRAGEMMEKMKGSVASSSALMTKVNFLMSDEDKALLKQKEDDLKAKRDSIKTLLDSYGGSTKNLTEEQKTALKAKMEGVATAEKSLMETRKTVMDKVVNSLSDSEKAMVEKMKGTMEQSANGGQVQSQKGREGENRPVPGVFQNGSSSVMNRQEIMR